MGLVILGAVVLYVLISIVIVLLAIRHAKKGGKSATRWGWGAALVMYLIPFWDWLPTVGMHQYYCATEAGFWIYKTPEQWMKENPGVMQNLVATKGEPHTSVGNSESYVDTYVLNQRFNIVVDQRGPLFINRWRYQRSLRDSVTNMELARYVDFSTSQQRRQAGWSGWKIWLDSRHCSGGRENAIKSGNWMKQFKGADR